MRFVVALMALVCFVMSVSCGPGAHILRAINNDSETYLDVAIVHSSHVQAGLLHEFVLEGLDDGVSPVDAPSQGPVLGYAFRKSMMP